MKKIIHLFCLSIAIVLFNSCSSSKQASISINSGNFDNAIRISLDKLKKNKTKKGNQKYIVLLEDAYQKAVKRDLSEIQFLEKENNPENLQKIYDAYLLLKDRQQSVTSLFPLYLQEQGRNARFETKDYTQDILNTKNQLTSHLYNKTTPLLKSNNKYDYRTAFETLNYINSIHKGYKDVENLIQLAHDKGTDYVYLDIKNDTEQVIPKRLETDLLDISTYGLNDLWTVYHTQKIANQSYDYNVNFIIKNIEISPERVSEKQFVKEREITEEAYKLDSKGNKVKDDKGNYIKVNVKKNVTCEYFQFTQFKSSTITGDIKVINNYNQQQIESFPIASQYVFEHIYANYKGDKRALNGDLLEFIDAVSTKFPTTEQMIYDTGEELKAKMKATLKRIRFNQ